MEIVKNMVEIRNGNNMYYYDSERFKPSYQPINKDESKLILEDCLKVFNNNNLEFSLCMGTLLGAFRNGDFIDWDYDIDVAVKYEDKTSILDCIPEFEKFGIKVCRYDGALLSLERNNSYIDFYFFKKYYYLWRKCVPGIVTRNSFIEDTKKINFLGTEYNIPSETDGYLKYHYGDWKTPNKESTLIGNSSYIKFRDKINYLFPKCFKAISKIKKNLC